MHFCVSSGKGPEGDFTAIAYKPHAPRFLLIFCNRMVSRCGGSTSDSRKPKPELRLLLVALQLKSFRNKQRTKEQALVDESLNTSLRRKEY